MTDFARLERLAPDWKRLFEEVLPPGSVFQSWEWTRAFWKAHGDELALCTPVVFDGDRLAGVLPVAVRGRRAQFLGAPYADYSGILCAEPDSAEIISLAFRELLQAPFDWTECVLDSIPESSPLVQDGPSFPSWLREHRQTVLGCACFAATDPEGGAFERLSRKQSLRRHRNRLSRRGEIRFRHIEDRNEILNVHLHRFFEMQVARQALRGLESVLLPARARKMVQSLVEELDTAGELRFSVLEVDGRPVAYHFGFQHRDSFICYMPTFDIDLWDDAPGEVLLSRLFKYAHEQKLAKFDLTIGEEAYKNRFASQTGRTFTAYFYRQPHAAPAVLLRGARAARDAVRRRPGPARMARRVLSAFRAVRRDARTGEWGRFMLAGLSRLCRFDRVLVLAPGTAEAAGPPVELDRLALKELALLSLQHRAPHSAELDLCRRRIKQGELPYLASAGNFRGLFWVGGAAGLNQGLEIEVPAAVIHEGDVLRPGEDGDRARSIAALARTIDAPGSVWLVTSMGSALENALCSSGCLVQGRLLRVSIGGRVRFTRLHGIPASQDKRRLATRAS